MICSMDSLCITISDSDEQDELPSLSFSSESDVAESENVADTPGNPNRKRTRKNARFESRSKHRKSPNSSMQTEDIVISSEDDVANNENDQSANASIYQSFIPVACSQSMYCHPHTQKISSFGSPFHIPSETEFSDTLPDLKESFSNSVCKAEHVRKMSFSQQGYPSPKHQFPMGYAKVQKERHFLDPFMSSSKDLWAKNDRELQVKDLFGSDKNGEETESKTYKTKRDKDTQSAQKIDTIHGCDKNGSETQSQAKRQRDKKDQSVKNRCETELKTDQTKRRRDRISQEMQGGSTPIHQQEYVVFTFPLDCATKPVCKTMTFTPNEIRSKRLKNRFSGVQCLQNMSLVPSSQKNVFCEFVKLQTECLHDLFEDLNDPCNFLNSMDLLEDFCFKRKPHCDLLQKIITNAFFLVSDEMITFQSYQTVLNLWQRYPDLIRIDTQSVLLCGNVVRKHLQNTVSLSENASSKYKDTGDKEKPNFQQARLYLQLVVKGLQLDLAEHTLADQKSVNKSLAFALLSRENSKTLRKQVIFWLESCLIVRHKDHVDNAKLWLHELQTLLEVSIVISRDQHEAAKDLALELKRTYKYLTMLDAKKQLLQSFTSPLLCFYVLRIVMEDECESTILSSQFPSSIEEVMHNYFFVMPPQDHLTPPPSPLVLDDEEITNLNVERYSTQSCEELAMLIFFLTKSFILCLKKRLNFDLRQQILKGPNATAMTDMQKKLFLTGVKEFGAHLRNFSNELSSTTITYLHLLESLCAVCLPMERKCVDNCAHPKFGMGLLMWRGNLKRIPIYETSHMHGSYLCDPQSA